MAGYRVEKNITNVDRHLGYPFIGYDNVTLSEFETTNTPQILAGSEIEINGSLYRFDANESIANYEANKTTTPFAVVITANGDTCSAEAVNIQPSWNPEKNGLYISENQRALSYGFDTVQLPSSVSHLAFSDLYTENLNFFWYHDDLCSFDTTYVSDIPGYYRVIRYNGFTTSVKDAWNLPNGRVSTNFEDEFYAAAAEPNGNRIAFFSGRSNSKYLEVWTGWKGSVLHRVRTDQDSLYSGLIYWEGDFVIGVQYDSGNAYETKINANSGAVTKRQVFNIDSNHGITNLNGYYDAESDTLKVIGNSGLGTVKTLSKSSFAPVGPEETVPRPPGVPSGGYAPMEYMTNNAQGRSTKWNWSPGTGHVYTASMPGDLDVTKFYVNKNMKIFPDGSIKLFRREAIYDNANGTVDGIYKVGNGNFVQDNRQGIHISTSGTLAYNEIMSLNNAIDVELIGNTPPLAFGEESYYHIVGHSQGSQLYITSYTPIADLPQFRGYTATGRVTATENADLGITWLTFDGYSIRGNYQDIATEEDGVEIIGTLNPEYTFWSSKGAIILDEFTNPGPTGYWEGTTGVYGNHPFVWTGVSVSSAHGGAQPIASNKLISLSGNTSGIDYKTVRIWGYYNPTQDFPSMDGNIDVVSWEEI